MGNPPPQGPPSFTDQNGFSYWPDPSGDGTYRAFSGDWTFLVVGGPDDVRLVSTNDPGSSQMSAPPAPIASGDGVSSVLELVGWAAVAIAIVGALIIVAAAADGAIAAVGIAVGGSLQGLILVGFARLIEYTKRSADSQREIERLLRQVASD